MSDVSTVAVFLLAENRLLREALARILDKKNDIAVTGSSALSALAMDQVMAAAADVLVLDSFTGSADHVGFLREVQQRTPGVNVLMIGMEDDEPTFLRCVRAGVVGYV